MPNNHDGYAVKAEAFVAQLEGEKIKIEGKVLRVTTRSGSVYLVDDAAQTISKNGGPARPGFVQGATFGGSMLMMGRLLTDAHMEFVMKDEGEYGATYTTTPLASIEVLK